MTSVLVMGGTGFFGKRLVEQLLSHGCVVTVATRGRHDDPFGDRVFRLVMDRQDRHRMQQAVGNAHFDLVFDQIGYGPDDIADACEVFAGKVGRYIFTSSVAVYEKTGVLTEEDFDPCTIDPGNGRHPPLSYREGKRKAEAYLFQRAPFPCAAARLPVVIGPDDTTHRFQHHVQSVMRGTPVIVTRPDAKLNYIWADDAGRFLAWLGLTGRAGAYNGASAYALSVPELLERIGHVVHRPPKILTKAGEGVLSEYGRWAELVLDASKAEHEGFAFTAFEDWFPRVVEETVRALGEGR